ncbi:ABC transporter ATP-binding protein [Agromyces rhizosphaerae]|uniref:ABC transporter ATP-binding protein n=1 Tax=Agromyces rhizosphaerae TaxID=88374 RepID=A0A9W6CWJ8_9MICO|nr:ABC transporter ATP-binding protein [Agromyces rhizosphaerae]GLI27351.1 ABC transporter ATP-binding protein [Agromyces rhizosphaerae]
MARAEERPGLTGQIRMLLSLAGASGKRWLVGTVGASVVLAALDTLGVAAMVPLTQLATGADTDEGTLGTISDFFGTDDPGTLIPIVAGFVALFFIAKSIGSLAFRWWLLGRTTRVAALTAAEMARRYMLSPFAAHRTRKMSEIYRSIGEATNQSASVLLALVTISTDALVLIAITGVLAVASPVVTIFAVVLFGVLVYGSQVALKRTQHRLGEEFAAASLQAWQYLLPGLDGFREARLTSSSGSFVDGYRGAKLRQARASRLVGIVSDAPRYLLEIGFVVAIMGISAILFATGTPEHAITVLGVFAAASLRALPTMTRISANIATIRIGRAGLRILTDAADELASQPSHDEERRSAERYEGDIELRDVTFRYPDSDQPVVHGLDLRIAENRTTAFVGSSGAGKSTLVDLVLGLLTPTEGTVECGGRSIGDDPASWYAELGVVPQDVFLLNDTLAANIAFGVAPEGIDADRIAQVIAMAQLDALVAELPEGLETVVGERGVRLSGGQRQRIGLARALYRRPRVLVLDEATSALDNATEYEISSTLARLQGSMTILIVAHRLSTVRRADTLVFLKSGSVEASGTFDQVRDENPEFARLVELGDLS